MMIDQDRNKLGWYTRKGETERKVRSIRLTDKTWDTLEEKAADHEMSKADFLEALVAGEIKWNEDEETESNVDFDVDEVGEILKEALTLKANKGGQIKIKIKEALEIMGIDLDEKD